MSHSDSQTAQLTQWLSELSEDALAIVDGHVVDCYGKQFMTILAVHGDTCSRADTLHEVLSKLYSIMSQQQFDNAKQTIEDYRHGLIPLVVPVTLLNHYYQDLPEVLDDVSCFLAPYPPEMQLMNRI